MEREKMREKVRKEREGQSGGKERKERFKERKGHISLDPSSPLASSLAPFVLTSPQHPPPPTPPPPAPTPNLHASASFPSPSPLFMKVNLWVYQELLAGGGLRRSNHNKASPSAWNRNGAEGKTAPLPSARIYARCHTHTSHYLLTSLPVVFLLSLLIPATLPSRSGSLVGWFFFFFFSFFSAPLP